MLQRVDDEADAGEKQRHRQQLSHRGTAPQEAELRVGLAEEFAERARQRIADGKAADDQTRPLQRAGAHQQCEHDQQHSLPALPRRAGSDGAAAARRPETPSPRARRLGGPTSSPLMKLAMRPRNRPIGPTAQVRSPSERIGMPRLSANSTTATTQPVKPPWNDMPPFHSCKISSGCCSEMRQIVEQHIADAAAEDDAERHPQHEIVEVGDGQRRFAAPQRCFGLNKRGRRPSRAGCRRYRRARTSGSRTARDAPAPDRKPGRG